MIPELRPKATAKQFLDDGRNRHKRGPSKNDAKGERKAAPPHDEQRKVPTAPGGEGKLK